MPNTRRASRKPLLHGFSELVSPEHISLLRKGGEKGASTVGAAVATVVLFYAGPDLTRSLPDLMSHVIDFARAVNEVIPDSSPVGLLMGAKAFTDSVATEIYQNTVVPAAGFMKSAAPSIGGWAAAQRDSIVSIGDEVVEVARAVMDHLAPKNAGEAVEKGIIALAALKSFSEGLEIAARAFRRVGRSLMGLPPKRSHEENPEPPSPPVVIEHHHHYHGYPPEHHVSRDNDERVGPSH